MIVHKFYILCPIQSFSAKSDSLKFSVIFLRSPQDIYVQTLTKASTPMPYMEMVASIAEGIKEGEFSDETRDLEDLLGRKPTTAKAFLKEVYATK